MWSLWANANFVADLNLEAAAIVTSRLFQPLEGGGLMVIYLSKMVCCHLASEDVPQVSMDPLVFMLAPCSMTNAEYDLWGLGIPFTERVIVELDYDKFNGTHLRPSLIALVCVLDSLVFL